MLRKYATKYQLLGANRFDWGLGVNPDASQALEGCGDAAAAAELQEKFHSAVSRRGPQSFREGSAQSRRAGEKAAKVVAALEGVLRSGDGFGGPPRPF